MPALSRMVLQSTVTVIDAHLTCKLISHFASCSGVNLDYLVWFIKRCAHAKHPNLQNHPDPCRAPKNRGRDGGRGSVGAWGCGCIAFPDEQQDNSCVSLEVFHPLREILCHLCYCICGCCWETKGNPSKLQGRMPLGQRNSSVHFSLADPCSCCLRMLLTRIPQHTHVTAPGT
jgi:hypothetical protein